MPLVKRDSDSCVRFRDGSVECYGFWYTTTGIIVKWTILGAIFLFFMAWFVGGHMHAKRRLRKGLPLLAYHRWLVPYRERVRYGQAPQNHFTFYHTQPPYGQPQQPYGQRPDGTWSEPPPMYNYDAPPQYVPPPGATKMDPNQGYEMQPPMGVPPQSMGAPVTSQQPNAPGGSSSEYNPPETQPVPPRPERAKLGATNFLSRFRR